MYSMPGPLPLCWTPEVLMAMHCRWSLAKNAPLSSPLLWCREVARFVVYGTDPEYSGNDAGHINRPRRQCSIAALVSARMQKLSDRSRNVSVLAGVSEEKASVAVRWMDGFILTPSPAAKAHDNLSRRVATAVEDLNNFHAGKLPMAVWRRWKSTRLFDARKRGRW